MSPSTTDYARYIWQMINGFRSNAEQGMAEHRRRDVAPYLDLTPPLRILDVANGRLRPQYTILKAAGHHVYGIDLVNRPRFSRADVAYEVARRLYTWKLGIPTNMANGRTLVCSDVGVLPFPDHYFDLATSVAAFEHFRDVPAVVAELGRVIRPGGVIWVSIHLFTCPSGGHNASFTEYPLRNVPANIDPWDHLRKRRLPFTVPLNEWRKDQYLATFARHFQVLKDYCLMREGEELLTPAIASELSNYSQDELTCGAYVIVARKAAEPR
jgi:ubiquinone/menaquinone biosynthesis C-methylase UbiE